LARKDPFRLVVIGTGVQARAHLRAVSRVRKFGSVCVAGRDHKKAEALAREFGGGGFREVGAYVNIDQAVREADVICACTHSAEPVVRREWLKPGAHINSVGYNTAGREIDGATFRDALVVVESRAATLAAPPAGSHDIAVAIAEGALTRAHLHAELGELVSGARPGRTNASQITLYKSVGVAVQDAAAAAVVLDAARAAAAARVVNCAAGAGVCRTIEL